LADSRILHGKTKVRLKSSTISFPQAKELGDQRKKHSFLIDAVRKGMSSRRSNPKPKWREEGQNSMHHHT